MYNELTEIDIRKMREEIEHINREIRPKCVADLQTARAFGDLSENYEYKAAKQELRRCDSRLRYLKKMIETAKIVRPDASASGVKLFDEVDVYFVDDDEVETFRIVTTLRENALSGIISNVSPMGRALLGRNKGDRVRVKVSDKVEYDVIIRDIRPGTDDDTLPIRSF